MARSEVALAMYVWQPYLHTYVRSLWVVMSGGALAVYATTCILNSVYVTCVLTSVSSLQCPHFSVCRVGQNGIYVGIWPYIWWFLCQNYRIYTVYIWLWPTLHTLDLYPRFSLCVDLYPHFSNYLSIHLMRCCYVRVAALLAYSFMFRPDALIWKPSCPCLDQTLWGGRFESAW
jgi:hypothetical protein